MRIHFSMLALPIALVLPTACWAQSEPTLPAQKAAAAWLALTDSGQYAASWESAAEAFKSAVAKATWSGALTSARSPFGEVKSRKLKSAMFTHNLPGAPDGEYVVIQYDTQFANKASAVETITPMHEKDGSWRVCGYYVK